MKLSKVMSVILAIWVSVLSFSSTSVYGGGYLYVTNTGIPYKWDASKPVPFNPDRGTLGVLSNTDAAKFVLDNFNLWSTAKIPTSALSFVNAGALPIDVRTVADFNRFDGVEDGINPIIFDANGSLFSDLGFEPGVLGFARPELVRTSSPFFITEGRAALNGAFLDGNNNDGREITLEQFALTFVHEFGHFLNLDHSQVNGHFFLGDTDDPGFVTYGAPPMASVNVMFPIALGLGQPTVPQTDDIRTISALYPAGGFPGNFGKIAGSVFQKDGTTLFQGANVIARNPFNPFFDAGSNVSGALFAPDYQFPAGGTPNPALRGAYSLSGLTANGAYTIEVVNVNPEFVAGSSVGPVDPPIALGGPEEFHNGANESASPVQDNPLNSTRVTAQTGAGTSGINVIINNTGAGLNPPRNLTASASGNSVALRWEAPVAGGLPALISPAAPGQQYVLKSSGRKAAPSVGYDAQPAKILTANTVIGEVEPNNSVNQAQVLTGASPLGVDGKAEVADAGDLVIEIPNVGKDDMEDLFKVTTTAAGLKINLDGFTSDCDIYVVNPVDLRILASSDKIGATTPEEINKTDLPAGTYLIAVTIFDPAPAGGPTTPYRLTVTGQFGGGTATVQAYNVYRSTSSPVQITPQNKIGNVNGSTTTFNDPNLASGTYFYVVTAAYNQGESGPSNQASAQVGGGCALTWKADLTIKDAGSGGEKLSLGQGPLSTNDIDNACGEADLPPPPPTGVFDARFELPVSPVKSSRQDYRNDAEQTATWRVKFQPGVSGPITFSWNSAEFSNGSFFLKDEITGTLVNVNMKAQNSFSLTQAAITSLKIEYSREAAREVSVNSGWNIISVPLAAANMAVSSLFPDAASPAFEFNNGYAAATTLANGKGYWIKFNGAKNYRVSGNSVPTREIPVKAGWNIIGAFENEVPTSAITSVPAGIVASPYFGFNNGYSSATTLSPGKGYWVKASQAGVLRLPSGIATGIVSKASPGDHEVDSAWPKLIIEDQAGNVATLYLAPVSSASFELPPVPPAGIFDVRFSSDQYVESLDNSREIHLSAVQYPIRLKAQNLGARVINVKDLLGGNLLNATLTEGKPLVVTKALDKIVMTASQLPAQFALSQNYPNPFNPQTAIKFSLPKKAHVSIAVFNLLGEKVAELANQEMEAGYHQIQFDARGHASGLYFYVMQAGDFKDMKKMIITK